MIDDYFAIAKIPRGLLVDDPALDCFERCKKKYKELGILGSDDKDVVGADEAKIIGAYVNGSSRATDKGHVLLSAPPAKRFSLSWLTLQISQLTHTTDSLHLCLLGGWTSVLMFRRAFMSILQRSFHLVDLDHFDASLPQLVSLPRNVVNELVLLAVLVPLMTSDLAAVFSEHIFATDASLAKGAIVRTRVSTDLARCIWRACRSKGGYSKLLTAPQAVLSRCFDFEETDIPREEKITRPSAFRFDFIEIFAGAATVTKHVAMLGFSVGPPIELSYSEELDMKQLHVLEWILHLIQNHYVKAFMIEPPCTTFSIMRNPPLRSASSPFGFDPYDPQTRDGTELAHKSFEVMQSGEYNGVTGILENPWTSKIKFLPGYEIVAKGDHCDVVRCDSCAYGSIHLKSFLFMCVWAEVAPISKRCDGSHSHVLVQGQYTKQSATYVEDLAAALALVFAAGIRHLNDFLDHAQVPKCEGLESQLVNELCCSMPWEIEDVWNFRISPHINLLELSVVVRLVEKLAKQGRAGRIVVLVDSNVVKCAASKGRSSSKLLGKALCRLAAICVIAGIYLVLGYVPTRLNPADDPTRDAPLRIATPGLGISSWESLDLLKLSAVPRVRRWISNWVRLVLLLCGPNVLHLCDRNVYRRPRYPYGLAHRCPSLADFSFPRHSVSHPLDFDSTLGYPGEGPLFGLTGSSCPFLLAVAVWITLGPLCHGVLVPRTPGDFQRQAARSSRPPLQEGRPVLGVTN